MAVVAAAAAVTFTAGACSPAGSSDNPGPSGSKGSGSGGSSSAFVVARTGDIDKLDPHLSTAFQTNQTLGLVYDSLVKTDDQGKLAGALATKWSVSGGGRTITFDLRQGVKWQDGDPFTSADVKASLTRILDEKTGAVARSNLTQISKVDAPDAHTVVLHLTAPDTAIFYALASTNAAILHAKDIKDGSVGKKPDGTGPFAWKKWDQGQQVVLKGNKDYWGSPVKIGTLKFRVIPSESSILSGMRAGAFQVGIISDPGVAKQADGGKAFNLVKQPTLAYHVLQLNGRRSPLGNLKVRQAIACAVDRKEVINTAAFGDGKVTGPITSPGYQYSPTDGLPCKPGDLDSAKKLLSESGVSTPVNLTTIVETGEYATSAAEGQSLQSQLDKIGVHLKLKQLSTKPYVQAWLDADFDAAVALNGGSSDPSLMYGRYYTTDGSLKGPAGLSSKSLNNLLVKGNSTTNEPKRQTIYRQLQRQLLKESPWVWVFRGDSYYLVSDKVTGFSARPDEGLDHLASSGAR